MILIIQKGMLFRMSCCIYFASRAAAANYEQMGITTQREDFTCRATKKKAYQRTE